MEEYVGTKILIYGAGTIGSIFAGKLAKYENDITILARGSRYDEITSNGIILCNALTKKTETLQVRCIKELPENDVYDYIIVVVQNNQIDPILPILSKNKTKNIVFVINNPLGYSKYIAAVGKERVMIGFPSAGGERKDGIVSYFIGTGLAKIMQTTTFAEVDGSITERLQKLVKIFKKAKFDPTISSNMDAWQKTHIAFVVPIANALIRFNSNNKMLAKSRQTINEIILATREAFYALKQNGLSIEPQKLNYYYMPKWLLCTFYQVLFLTKISEYSMAKHTIVAKQEIDIIEEQFLNLFKDNDFSHWKNLHLTTAST
ncbi:MAG TPA: 2-dehydropantoate 2-reductase N-terminal domain-containing protein [Paludibacteraceae bacterium]|nr:2-dehydropantoate 2-reductase N-terminal domain-containing protein [Paludibacteraceae bacterium]